MEFLEGEPLEDLLKRRQKVRLADVLRIGREVALGLVAAQQAAASFTATSSRPTCGWKRWDDDSAAGGEPQPASGEQAGPLGPFRVKILDFGLARAVREEGHLTQSGVIVGTPAYMAPEQAKGRHVDGRCDLFSLGCVLYRLCTGELPFKGSDSISTLLAVAHETLRPPRELSPDLPASVSDLIMRLLAKDPVERTQSAATWRSNCGRSPPICPLPPLCPRALSRRLPVAFRLHGHVSTGHRFFYSRLLRPFAPTRCRTDWQSVPVRAANGPAKRPNRQTSARAHCRRRAR